MRNILTTKQIRDKYNPDFILMNIESIFEENIDKLSKILSNPDSPLHGYDTDVQISFLESDKGKENLVKQISFYLRDTLYFMTLTKRDRTRITQKMRNYYSDVIENQFLRVKLLLDDPEIGTPKQSIDTSTSHKGMKKVNNILGLMKKSLEYEHSCRKNLSRAGYLTGLQVSMGDFFIYLNKISMIQKDQISLVQHIFDEFNVDWSEVDRENIKLSIQTPSLDYYKRTKEHIQRISGFFYSSAIDNMTLSNMVEQATLLAKRIRRF